MNVVDIQYSKEIAELLHEVFCRRNHTDQCSWYYESGGYFKTDPWKCNEHERYLAEATYLIEKYSYSVAKEFILEIKRFMR